MEWIYGILGVGVGYALCDILRVRSLETKIILMKKLGFSVWEDVKQEIESPFYVRED